jgi:soluble lytic murein transglycosylase-like protein
VKKLFIFILLVISCPRPGVRTITPPDYLREARRVYRTNPLYAYQLIKDSTKTTMPPGYARERTELLVHIYLDQREYEHAAALLDSFDWTLEIDSHNLNTILLRTQRWDVLAEKSTDTLLLGIAYYHLKDYERAIQYLSLSYLPDDYRLIYCAKAYQAQDDAARAFAVLAEIDSVSPYLSQTYQNLLFELCMSFEDTGIVRHELKKLNKPHIQDYIMLRLYERQQDKKNLQKTAWKLIRSYPKTEGARYAVQLVKATTKADHRSVGRVYYYHGDYDKAIEHLTRSIPDDGVNYYLGMIHYYRSSYSNALSYLGKSNWDIAYYYRGRTYEKLDQYARAIAVYDSLYMLHKQSKHATNGYKRKAFLLEDIGDTLQAVQTLLRIKDKNTMFRAALQLLRVGDLHTADSILGLSTDAEFLYWRIRTKERLGESADNLKDYLMTTHPFSYYTLVRNAGEVPFDSLPLDQWMEQFRDSIPSLTRTDSIHIQNAIRYFELNEIQYGIEELEMIPNKSAHDYLYLSRLCAEYGADRLSILYGLKIKGMSEKNGRLTIPLALFKLIYPVRYTLTIAEQGIDPSLCLAMIWQESLFDPGAISIANARGIMQIIPPTAEKIAQDLAVHDYSLHDPRISIRFGCYYFLNLYGDFQSVALSLAGYNAGPMRVKRWIKNNPNYEIDEFIDLIPYNETRNYIKLILARQMIYSKLI